MALSYLVFGDDVRGNCGIVYAGTFPPLVLEHEAPFCGWIVFDSTLYVVSFADAKHIREIRLESCYWDAMILEDRSLLVIHELGASCYRSDGEKLWELSGHDKINNYKLVNDRLELSLDDGQILSTSINQDRNG